MVRAKATNAHDWVPAKAGSSFNSDCVFILFLPKLSQTRRFANSSVRKVFVERGGFRRHSRLHPTAAGTGLLQSRINNNIVSLGPPPSLPIVRGHHYEGDAVHFHLVIDQDEQNVVNGAVKAVLAFSYAKCAPISTHVPPTRSIQYLSKKPSTVPIPSPIPNLCRLFASIPTQP